MPVMATPVFPFVSGIIRRERQAVAWVYSGIQADRAATEILIDEDGNPMLRINKLVIAL